MVYCSSGTTLSLEGSSKTSSTSSIVAAAMSACGVDCSERVRAREMALEDTAAPCVHGAAGGRAGP
jgi:hypothetical protein